MHSDSEIITPPGLPMSSGGRMCQHPAVALSSHIVQQMEKSNAAVSCVDHTARHGWSSRSRSPTAASWYLAESRPSRPRPAATASRYLAESGTTYASNFAWRKTPEHLAKSRSSRSGPTRPAAIPRASDRAASRNSAAAVGHLVRADHAAIADLGWSPIADLG
jgi:hypothetical protein